MSGHSDSSGGAKVTTIDQTYLTDFRDKKLGSWISAYDQQLDIHDVGGYAAGDPVLKTGAKTFTNGTDLQGAFTTFASSLFDQLQALRTAMDSARNSITVAMDMSTNAENDNSLTALQVYNELQSSFQNYGGSAPPDDKSGGGS